MQFNSNATDQDCVSEVLQICGATTVEYPINDIARRFNSALDKYFSMAFEFGMGWSLDDINNTNPPIDTQNIVSGTNRYKFSAFTQTILEVLRIEILNSDGKGKFLTPERFNNLGVPTIGSESGKIDGITKDTFQELYINASSGTPTHYCKFGDFIYLRPNPDYSLADALIVYFNQPASYIAATDTTKVPGVPVIHHTYLCRETALPYLIEKKLPQAGAVSQMIQIDEDMIKRFFSNRSKEFKKRLIPNVENCR